MQALVLENARDLHLRDIPEPAVGPLDVLIKVKACGICGSDVHGYDGATGRRIPPLVMGHEAAGVVAKIGAEVHSFRIGDRVTFDSTISCGKCLFCSKGDVNLCDNRHGSRRLLQATTAPRRRGFAEYVFLFPNTSSMVYPTRFHLRKRRSSRRSQLLCMPRKSPAASSPAIQAVVIRRRHESDSWLSRRFQVYGCSKIIAVDLEESKLALARSLGADETMLATDPDLSAKLKASTEGRGPDIAVEVVGIQKSILTAIENVRRGGTVTLVGNLAPVVEIPLQTVVTRQLKLQGSCASAGEYRECIHLMDTGAINVDPLISALAPLSEGAEWFNRLYAREPGLMKVILQP